MEKLLAFLDRGMTPFYIATVEQGQPRVRPFAFIMVFDGKLYFDTGASKDVYKQLAADPTLEICSTPNLRMEWIRLRGTAVMDTDNLAAKEAAFQKLPLLQQIYGSPSNPEVVLFYLQDIQARLYDLQGKNEVLL